MSNLSYTNLAMVDDPAAICALYVAGVRPEVCFQNAPDLRLVALYKNKYQTKRLLRAYAAGTLEVPALPFKEALDDIEHERVDRLQYIAYSIDRAFKRLSQ